MSRSKTAPFAKLAGQLSALLAESGFTIIDNDREGYRLLFTRPAADSRLYEQILVDSDGIKLDVAAADARISLTRGFNVIRGMFERTFIHVAGASDRGWSPIQTENERRHFAGAVAAHAPTLLSRLSQERGQHLLRTHEPHREVVLQVLGNFPGATQADLLDLLERLRGSATEQQRAYAWKMREWPAVMCVRNGGKYYETATLMLLDGTRPDDGSSPYLGRDPMDDDMKLSRILQLIVDVLRFGSPS